ncbi:CLUMA_CG005650, isoform A [Clunio marinus]|uniref:CLUMA_CG005650, isoform A n=1 Tax=Clunio marinus TaxID=568069 RepID=A0A1J1HZU5_9DIPT|nr:CLUMA_CG005650, isoform A [Clunio marinus]
MSSSLSLLSVGNLLVGLIIKRVIASHRTPECACSKMMSQISKCGEVCHEKCCKPMALKLINTSSHNI